MALIHHLPNRKVPESMVKYNYTMSQSIAESIAKNVSNYGLLVKNKKQGTTAAVINSVKNIESIL